MPTYDPNAKTAADKKSDADPLTPELIVFIITTLLLDTKPVGVAVEPITPKDDPTGEFSGDFQVRVTLPDNTQKPTEDGKEVAAVFVFLFGMNKLLDGGVKALYSFMYKVCEVLDDYKENGVNDKYMQIPAEKNETPLRTIRRGINTLKRDSYKATKH